MKPFDKAVLFFATGFGFGRAPKAPGTFGTLPGLLLWWLLSLFPSPTYAIFLFLFLAVGTLAAHMAESILGKQDPGCIVVDEMAGILVALWGISPGWKTAAAGFFLFRLLDIFKPLGIGWIDRKISGGPGIMADDVAAGVLTNAAIRLAWAFSAWFAY